MGAIAFFVLSRNTPKFHLVRESWMSKDVTRAYEACQFVRTVIAAEQWTLKFLSWMTLRVENEKMRANYCILIFFSFLTRRKKRSAYEMLTFSYNYSISNHEPPVKYHILRCQIWLLFVMSFYFEAGTLKTIRWKLAQIFERFSSQWYLCNWCAKRNITRNDWR